MEKQCVLFVLKVQFENETKFHNIVRGYRKRCGSYNEINNFGVTEHITARSSLPISVPLAGRTGGRNHCCNVKH
jgi:hypothetical protein